MFVFVFLGPLVTRKITKGHQIKKSLAKPTQVFALLFWPTYMFLWSHVTDWPVRSRLHGWGRCLCPWWCKLLVDVCRVKGSTLPLFFSFCSSLFLSPGLLCSPVALLSVRSLDFSPAEDLLSSQLTSLRPQSVQVHVLSVIAFLVTAHNVRTEARLTAGQSTQHVCVFLSSLYNSRSKFSEITQHSLCVYGSWETPLLSHCCSVQGMSAEKQTLGP